MTSEQMSNEVAAFFEEANTLQWKKNADYHPDKVAMLEILQTAWECNITVEQDLWAKIRKQYIALHSFVIDGKLESESPRSRMIDVAVYMGILAYWCRHKQTILRDTANFVETNRRCQKMVAHRECLLSPGMPIQDRCDRCRFVEWLLQQHAR
jgi:hypothetical protein